VPAPPAAQAPAVRPLPYPTAGASTIDLGMSRGEEAALREGFEHQRNGGVALIIFSILAGTAGGILVSVGDENMIIAGYVISPFELILGIPGIALVVTGSTGLGKLDKGIPITQAGPRLRVGAAPAITIEF
jgi:hypothetical protein